MVKKLLNSDPSVAKNGVITGGNFNKYFNPGKRAVFLLPLSLSLSLFPIDFRFSSLFTEWKSKRKSTMQKIREDQRPFVFVRRKKKRKREEKRKKK